MKFDGILFFPVTPFDAAGRVDEGLAREHVASRLPYGPGGVFAACGTGEYHALTAQEAGAVVRSAVEAVREAGADVPVLGGAGGPLGHALEAARAAEEAGAEGLLVLPPYLVNAPADGLVRYVEAIAAAADLELVIYHRANARFTPEAVAGLAANPQIVGFKDGVGDVALTQEVVLAVEATGRTDFQFFNGLLTAELSQGAYRGIGVPLYSSAAFAMAPEVALATYRATEEGDETRRRELLDRFYRPLVHLRDAVPGYGVSLVKAGVRLGGLEVGGVRPPLTDPRPEHLAELERILAVGRELAVGVSANDGAVVVS
ncbi:5-dehydro-4-deoxyglucarate dehydratase [Sinomonas albida]|uniref:5-dehydro-4-deoxyglucarate dehydratase n=1 Tax=Sinomonas albida TaxID=369942 RepID=UPI0010A8CB46|nr:5-dehydro-4-deoxyglucarate dehydratase [Sinomonas albida]